MTTFGPGSLVQRRRTRVGPVPWHVAARTLRSLGWVFWLLEEEDTDPGAGTTTFPFSFAGGWLAISRGWAAGHSGLRWLGDAHAASLAAHLAADGGRDVWWREESAELRPRQGAIASSMLVRERRFDPTGRSVGLTEVAEEEEFDLDADWIADESADAVAEESWDEVPLPGPEAGPADHAELAPRRGWLRPATHAHPVVCGPSVVFRGPGWELPLDAAGRCAIEAALRRANLLDEDATPPDLTRWRERAARRAGLAAPPEPGHPDHARWLDTLDELTRADRSAPGRDGKVAGWKLVTPGSWRMEAAEVGAVAACAGVPEPLRERSDSGWELEVASDAPTRAPPWTLTPPSDRT